MRRTDPWPRWWKREGEEQLRELLNKEWAPIGFVGLLPDDEYDSYLGPLSHLLRRGATAADVAAHLRDLRVRVITEMAKDDADQRAAALIHAWYVRSAPHGMTSGRARKATPS
jgi:hypothetical protein